MNHGLLRLSSRALAALLLVTPLAAQDDPPPTGNAAPAEEASPRGEITLNGIWGVEIGGRYTGVDVELRQLANVFRATYAKLPGRNPLGIRPGFDFCNGTLRGIYGRGIIQIRRKPKEGNGPPERSTAPIIMRVSEDQNRLTIRIQKEEMRAAERQIELVRPGKISNLRLYAAAPGHAQATGEILENVPMLVDVQVDSGALRPVEVTVTSGGREINLTAKPWQKDDGTTADSLRTEAFLPTFGAQLGVEWPEPDEEEAPRGREATSADFEPLAGVWKSVYADAVLGNITGWVHVSEFGQPRLNYEDPKTGKLKTLKLISARVDGELPAVPAKEDQAAMEALPKLILEFEGEGVRSDKIEGPTSDQYPTLLLDPDRPQPIVLSAKQVTAEVPLRFRDLPDQGKVILALDSRERPDLIVWKWHYLANRATNRDLDGYGRVGVMLRRAGDEESTVGEMTGMEAWMRHPPQIVTAFALNKQLAHEADRSYIDGPVAEYRYAYLKDANGLELLPRSGNLSRTVFVVARNLPPADAGDLTLKIGEGSGVEEYSILARGAADSPGNSEELTKGWEEYRRIEAATSTASVPRREVLVLMRSESDRGAPADAPEAQPAKEEGLLLRAIIKSAADPGPQTFTLNDAEGSWDLLYGDTVGTLSIARQLAASTAASGDLDAEAGEWEPTKTAFSPERLHLIVEVKHRVESIETIHAVLRVKNQFIEYKGDQKIPLKVDPNDPKLYISPPIEIVREADYERFKDQPDAIVIPHKVGTKLQASASRSSGYAIGPSMFETKILANPARLNRLWKDAVKRAADIAGQPISDWNEVARGEAGSATNFIITDFVFNQSIAPVGDFLSNLQDLSSYVSGSNIEIPMVRWWKSQSQSNNPVRSLKISIGDHAAMLLLKAEFVKMMQEQVRDWQSNQNSPAMRRIYAAQKNTIPNKQSPLSFIRIPIRSLPGYAEGAQSKWDRVRLFFGEEENPFLFQLFDNDVLRDDLRIQESDEMFATIQWEAFRWAYRQWGPKMRASINEALNTADSDVLGLLKLTGNGFEPVVPRLVPMLMKLEDEAGQNRNRWVPDRVARAYVKSLGVLGAAVRAQEELSEIDKTVVVTTAALASIALGNVGGIWSAWAALAIGVADLGYAIYTDVYRNSLNEDQLEFEIGAGAVLGANRVAETEAKILAGWQQAVSIGGSLLGIGGDSAAVVKALRTARAMKAADVIDAATEIMKRVDVADPAALRTLSKADQAILARYVEDAEALAAAGRVDEIGEQGADALRARDAIRTALESGENVAARAGRLDDAARAPALKLTRADLDEAAEELDGLIATRTRDLEDLKARPKPPEGSEQSRRLNEEATRIKDEIGDLSQRRQVVDTFLEPKVKVPKDVARIMNGEFDELTDLHRTGLNQTASRVTGNEAMRAEDLQEVNLSAARRRLSELGLEAQDELDAVRRAGNADQAKINAAQRRVDDLSEAHANVSHMEEHLADGLRVDLSKADLDLLKGKRLDLNDIDHALVEDAIIRSGHDWSDLAKRAGGDGHDQLLMHKVAQYRRNLVNKLADDAMAEVEAITGKPLTRDAFGSTNLSSDYDAAIKGSGAELAIRRFNNKIRKVFGGRESGSVVDTNLYTDPVYNAYKAAGLVGPEGKVTRAQLDTARQFLFQQMANAKYRTPEQWAKFREGLLDGVPPQAREAISDLLDQAQGANELAKGRIGKRLADLAENGPPLPKGEKAAEAAVANRKLAVTNDLYADTLEQIHNYRRFTDHLDEVLGGRAAAGGAPIPPVLQNTELGKSLARIDEMLASRNPLTRSAGREALENLKSRAILNMRSKQGEALYYAAEAYQTRGTISHVVGELQAGGKKVIASEILNGVRRETALGPDDYINSFYENGGNLIKELNGKHVLDAAGEVINVPGYMEKAATKGAKYFIRQIDAAHMAGVDFAKSGIPDVEKLVEATVELDKVRGEMAKFTDVLKKYGWTGEDYLSRVMQANQVLDGQVLKTGTLTDFAANLHSAERAAEYMAAFPAGTRPANGLLTLPRAYQASDRANRLRDDFAESEGARLATLNQAAMTGRHLTTEQQTERERLMQTAKAQNRLDQTVATARLAGVSPAEIERVLSTAPASNDPALLRNTAARKLLETTRQNLPTRSSWRGPDGSSPAGSIPAETRTALGLDSTRGANPSALAASLRASGQFVQRPETPLAADVLASHLQSGRQAIVLIDNGAGDGPAWVRVHRIDADRVEADDPLTGQPMTYPADVFEALSANRSELLIIDPYRDPEGALRKPTQPDLTLPDLDELIPLPGQE